MLSNLFPNAPEFNFGQFSAYNLPIMLLNMTVIWVWMQFWFMGMFRPNSDEHKLFNFGAEAQATTKHIIAQKYDELGPVKSSEWWVMFVFLVTVILWITRNPAFMPGWGARITQVQFNDAPVGTLTVIILFTLPMKWTWLDWFFKNKSMFYIVNILQVYMYLLL